eukprot:Cvel_29657.t1-p1 / transcript=Cvel_29657.t1 / gene=Cvel_29657 / organism=Chromera_velia_CCMP2878 / gene_product=hypothetical protein / transcript_product=hypothetical protein / location=Cvel_scaffold4096:9854-11154(+) / protein_length=189 / sequence_SO=supercontig / SO=protein_coding / is_pseudo=false
MKVISEQLAAFFEDVAGKHVYGISKEEVKVSFLKQSVEFLNLVVKPESLTNFLGLNFSGFAVKGAFIRRLSVTLKLLAQQAETCADGVVVVLEPLTRLLTSRECHLMNTQNMQVDELLHPLDLLPPTWVVPRSEENRKAIAGILNALQLKVRNVHIRIEGTDAEPGRGNYCFGLFAEEVKLLPRDGVLK